MTEVSVNLYGSSFYFIFYKDYYNYRKSMVAEIFLNYFLTLLIQIHRLFHKKKENQINNNLRNYTIPHFSNSSINHQDKHKNIKKMTRNISSFRQQQIKKQQQTLNQSTHKISKYMPSKLIKQIYESMILHSISVSFSLLYSPFIPQLFFCYVHLVIIVVETYLYYGIYPNQKIVDLCQLFKAVINLFLMLSAMVVLGQNKSEISSYQYL